MSKAPAPAAAATDTAPASGGKSKILIIIIGLLVVILLAGGGVAAYFFMHKPASKPVAGKTAAATDDSSNDEDPSKPPVFLPLDPFTVNLSPEEGEKYLQVAITVQVPNNDDKIVDTLKANMPLIRSRILLLLSSQKASDLLTETGKDALMKAITAELSKPFEPNGSKQKIMGVAFTSFVIQ